MRPVVYTLLVLLALAVAAAVWFRGDAAVAGARADRAESRAALAEDAVGYLQRSLQYERDAARAMSNIGETHERDRSDAAGVPAAVVADLRAGNRRLQEHWAACETRNLSAGAAATLERDAAAQRREADIGHLVQAGRDADDQLRACQAVIREYAGAGLTTGDGAER